MNIIDITSKIPICNYSKDRKGYKPSAITLHITGDSAKGQAISWFENPMSGVSAHYVIEKDGTIFMCVDPNYRAYHCGIVNKPTAQIYFDKGSVNPNNYTIGIECVSSGEALTDLQVKSLTELLSKLCSDFSIPKDRYHIMGHNELDTIDRKFDPVKSYSVDDVVKRIEVKGMYKDDDKISSYAKEAVENLNKLGIMKGDTDGNFRPLELITRQDLAVVVNNLLNKE